MMSARFRILALIPTLNEDPIKTVESILKQSVEVSKIIVIVGGKELYKKLMSNSLERTEYIYVKPNFRQPLGKRVGAAINTALAKGNFKEYDYILKVDSEITLPRDFVEKNLKEAPDFVGSGGFAMLFKTSAFLKLLGGRYPEVMADDVYLALYLLYKGCTVKRWRRAPDIAIRKKGHHSYRHHFNAGIEWYRLGYEPVHVLYVLKSILQDAFKGSLDIARVLPILGYFSAALRRIERYEFAPWIFRMQVRRLIYGVQFEY
jgi:glycosyltransferase involved in cell wall biosynthesis